MDVEETAVCLVSKNKSSEETDCEIEITSQSHTKPIKNEIRESDFSDEESKSVRLNKLFDEYLTKSSCQNDQNPDEEVIKSSSSSENRKTISETEVNSDRRIVLRKREDDLKVSMYDLDEINDENKQVELKVHDVNQERAAMYAVYQPWVIRTYGDFTKTKTVSLKKYDRIVKTLLGLIPNCAENSKFRFWIRSKGFRLGLPSSIALVSDPNQLYVLGRKSGIEGRSFRKVAVVEQFFEIIHQVHVESGGKHAGQKKTYRTITQTYAFLPREAVTKFLLGCFECQKRLVLDGQGSDILNYSSNKRTPVKRALKRKHNTWEPSPSPMIVDFATHSINLSVPLENKKQKFLKFHDDLNDPCLADDEEKSSDGYNPRVSWRRNFDTYLAPKIRSSNRDTFKPIKLQRNYDINRESGIPTNLRPLIDEESVDYRDEVLDLQCKSSSTYSSKKSHIKNECAYREKEDSTDSESVYKRETCPLDPRLETCNPIYNTTSECYFKHQIERDDFKRDYSLMVNVPNVLRPDPVLILKSSEERDLEKDKICRKLEVRPRIRDLDREQNSKNIY